jgi:hypothetical protein
MSKKNLYVRKNRRWRPLRILAITTLFSISAYFIVFAYGYRQPVDFQTPAKTTIRPIDTKTAADWSTPEDAPRLLTIAGADIKNAPVEQLDTKAGTNQFDDPHDPMHAGWYIRSAKPGQSGAGLYDCHSSFSSVIGGLCTDLGLLQIGDEIKIERGDGKKFSYIVVEKEEVAASQIDMKKMLQVANGSEQGISIITCSGEYISATGDATHRLTIRAVLK